MPTPTPTSDESIAEFLPLRSKEGRAQDAEAIRLEFVKSQGALAAPVDEQKSLPQPTENER